MALALVNNPAPTLSWKRSKSSANNSVLGKPKIISPFPSPISPATSKRCNFLQIKSQISSDPAALSVDQLDSDHKPHNSFPSDFIFGSGSSAYQVEGATNRDGRGPSIWDTFCEKYPDKIMDGSSGEPAAGSYDLYRDDVKLLADIGLKAYRFSISWSRVLPTGRDKKNRAGIRYYHDLIDELHNHGIEPFVTIFHWDLPQPLEDEYGGFVSRKIVKDFKNYAELLFNEFGHKVKHWTTINEPLTFCNMGYSSGSIAPGHCSPDLERFVCPAGDSLREPYLVAHNILLAHAEAVKLYREQFEATQGGKVGISLNSEWFEPFDNSPLNREAQKRALDFNLGWFLDPLKYGDYPFSMRALVRDRLPIFTEEESAKIKDSFDFIGLNYYTSKYAKDVPFNYTDKPKMCSDDGWYSGEVSRAGVPIGPAEPNSWVNVFPKGLKNLLLYIKERYNNPAIYVTENGVFRYDTSTQGQGYVDDKFRAEYHTYHLQALEEALSSRANVKGYFVWSLLDSFEWNSGYVSRFGLNHINYNSIVDPHNVKPSDLKRIPKYSADWLTTFLAKINKQDSLAIELAKEEAQPVVVINNP